MSPLVLSSQCPASGGAYILELNVREWCSLRVGKLGQLAFAPGRYLYVGSAYGPGGIAARVKRHIGRKGGRLHWHIDYLSAVVGVARVWAMVDGKECEIVSTLLTEPTTSSPMAGFGSSDCRRCSAHLLLAGQALSLTEVLGGKLGGLDLVAGGRR